MHSEIATQLRTVVSKKKRRYQQQGFNLDLSYVTDRIIAMGFPADNFEALYRNHIDDVVRFFKLKHDGFYKIYNLCREREFDASKFPGETVRYPFDDHNPPEFSVLIACVEDIANFLNLDKRNVVAINCKAGKGRTGVVVCCILLHMGLVLNADNALVQYGYSRTHNGKGVTIPSQIRYIYYYDMYINYYQRTFRSFSMTLNEGHPDIASGAANANENVSTITDSKPVNPTILNYELIPLWLKMIRFDVAPYLNNLCEIEFHVYKIDSKTKIYSSKMYKITKFTRSIIFNEPVVFPFYGDLKFDFVYHSVLGQNKPLCHCWLNTFFVVNQPPGFHRSHFGSNASHNRAMTTSPDSTSLLDDDVVCEEFDSISKINMRTPNTNNLSGDRRHFHQLRKSRSCQDILKPIPISPSSISSQNSNDCIEEKTSKSFNIGSKQNGLFTVRINKLEIDRANKDKNNKLFPKNFNITFIFSNEELANNNHSNEARKQLGNSQFFESEGLSTPATLTNNTSTFFNEKDSILKEMEKEWTATSKFYLNLK